MKTIRYLIYACGFTATLFTNSCSTATNENSSSQMIHLSDNATGDISISDFTSSRKIFCPQTTEKSLISFPLRIFYFENKYYILDNLNKINVFNENGEYKSTISHIGNGPGEYSRLNDFTIDVKRHQLLILSSHKILRYDLDGKFIDDINVPQAAQIAAKDDFAYLCNYESVNGSDINHYISIINLNTNEISQSLENDIIAAPNCCFALNKISFSNNQVWITRKFDTNIYVSDNNKCESQFKIDLGDKAFIPEKDREYDCSDFFAEIARKNQIYILGNIIAGNENIIVKSNLNQIGIINVSDSTLTFPESIVDPSFEVKLPISLFPIDGISPKVAVYISSSSAKTYAQLSKDPEISEALSSVTPQDNPVFIVYDVK